MTGRKIHGGNFRMGTAFELGPVGTAHHPPFWSTALTRLCGIPQSPHSFVTALIFALYTLKCHLGPSSLRGTTNVP